MAVAETDRKPLIKLKSGMNEVGSNLTIQVVNGRVGRDGQGNPYCFTHGALLVFNEATQSLRCSVVTEPCNAEATLHTTL